MAFFITLKLKLSWQTFLPQAFFMRCGKLIMEVIMARNIVGSSRKLPDTQVAMKLVPSEWFQSSNNAKTKIQRKNDTPVFEEKFEL